MPKETKTNAMRFLEQHKIPYRLYTYICEHFTDGVSVAQQLGQPPERTFKTLITQGRGRGFYVFVIPVAEELDVKKAARTVQEKSLHLLPVKNIFFSGQKEKRIVLIINQGKISRICLERSKT